MSKALKRSSAAPFSMAASPTQKLLGTRDQDKSTTGVGHMTNLVSALMDTGLSMGTNVESSLPSHQTDVGSLQQLMQELMNTYSIVGVSD